MQSTETATEPPLTGPRKVVAASMAGTVAEWYEFLLYSASSALVFGTVFFPENGNPLDGVINALLVYAVGFVARPLGGIVFGHFGDRVGRKKLLQLPPHSPPTAKPCTKRNTTRIVGAQKPMLE